MRLQQSASHLAPQDFDPHLQRVLLRRILKQVSRSFYLSLVILPPAVRPQVSLAYLFCRAADTIADTRILPHDERLRVLEVFQNQFRRLVPDIEAIAQLRDVVLPYQATEGERLLLFHLPECFQLLGCLSVSDQELIRELVLTLTRGMEMDLTCFPAELSDDIRALPDMAMLDRYTYYVAGVVGEFWTKIHAAHLAIVCKQELSLLCALGVRFGKGLQLTNILKDLGSDLANGRCYLPVSLLHAVQVDPLALRTSGAVQHLQPVLSAMVRYTLTHLDHAYEYVQRLPRRAVRLRLSCMWPLLFALQTLEVICTSPMLLSPHSRVKMSRFVVYQTMFLSLGCLVSVRVFTRYYAGLRHRLIRILDAMGEPIALPRLRPGFPGAECEGEA